MVNNRFLFLGMYNYIKSGGNDLVLEQLLNVVQPITVRSQQGKVDLEEISNKISEESIDITQLLQNTDQEIDDFIKANEISPKNQKQIFEVFQQIKIEMSIENISANIEVEGPEEEKKKITNYFSKFLEPDRIEVCGDEVKVVYNTTEGSKLKQKLDDIEAWEKDNVIETISEKLNIDHENICLIDNVGDYVKFISGFEEANYVSRGQKDCTFDLIPSLYRIYENGYRNHSSQFESAFRQKVLYYDKSIENKDAEELRAYAQHFGLPTNYLDFTEAHLISLLFAVEDFEYTDNHSIVYFVDALSYNQEVIRDEIKLVDFSDKNLKKTKEESFADKSYFIRVGNSNERIHFQKGCFLKVEKNDSLDYMFKKFTKIAIIDKDLKEDILIELFRLGITFENIYPDKDNMVKTIKFIRSHIN